MKRVNLTSHQRLKTPAPFTEAHSGFASTERSFLALFEIGNLNGIRDMQRMSLSRCKALTLSTCFPQIGMINSTSGFVLEVHPSWAPRAVKRFRELVNSLKTIVLGASCIQQAALM